MIILNKFYLNVPQSRPSNLKKLHLLQAFSLPFYLLIFSTFHLGLANRFSPQVALDVTIPSFDPDGRVSWTLKAEEVIPMEKSIYFVKRPNLKMVSKANQLSNATSDAGTFDLSNSTASGDTLLKVAGDGYTAEGNDWAWREETENGLHQLSFGSKAYVSFKSEIDPLLPVKRKRPDTPEKKVVNVGNTVAVADLIELVTLEKGGYLFVLDGNVSVKAESLEIFCLKMEVMVENENNQSKMNFGRITEVVATGSVKMKQVGRVCQADKLKLDTIAGHGLLFGNAIVEDKEWGIVFGEKIELEKSTGRARVIGTDEKRPRLELPNLGKINLPGLRKP